MKRSSSLMVILSISGHLYLDLANACLICANEDMNVDRMDNKSLYASERRSPRENNFCLFEGASFLAADDWIPISDKFDAIVVAHSSLLSLQYSNHINRRVSLPAKTRSARKLQSYLLKKSSVEQDNRHKIVSIKFVPRKHPREEK